MNTKPSFPLLLIACFVLAAVWSPGLADERTFRDPARAKGVLDIEAIRHSHRANEKGVRQLVHTIRLEQAWPVKKLRHRGFVHVNFQLPGHPGSPEERAVWIVYRRGHLVAKMYRTLGDPPALVGRAALWRPDWRTVKVAFPKSWLRARPLDAYKWNAVAFVEDGTDFCPRKDACFDWAPNPANDRRYVRHRL